jgi:hypothetical protein
MIADNLCLPDLVNRRGLTGSLLGVAGTSREVKINRETLGALEDQIQRFRDNFGRDPGLAAPLFFDPYLSEPVPIPHERLEREIEDELRSSGLSPEQTYAVRKTGALVR